MTRSFSPLSCLVTVLFKVFRGILLRIEGITHFSQYSRVYFFFVSRGAPSHTAAAPSPFCVCCLGIDFIGWASSRRQYDFCFRRSVVCRAGWGASNRQKNDFTFILYTYRDVGVTASNKIGMDAAAVRALVPPCEAVETLTGRLLTTVFHHLGVSRFPNLDKRVCADTREGRVTLLLQTHVSEMNDSDFRRSGVAATQNILLHLHNSECKYVIYFSSRLLSSISPIRQLLSLARERR